MQDRVLVPVPELALRRVAIVLAAHIGGDDTARGSAAEEASI